MPTITTAVRALQLGDVLVDPLPTPVGGASSYVVLDLAVADPGPVGVQLARLGPIPAHLDRVATVSWPADTVLEVVRPKQPASTTGVPEVAARTLLRVAAGVTPMHDGATSERSAELEQRRTRALALLEDVERLAAAGHVARVQLIDGEPSVSSATVHASVARAVEEARVKAWHAMVAERNNMASQLQGAAPREPYSVQPTRCSCHPETCGCKPWTLKQGAATVTGFQDRDAAIETAARLDRAP